MAPRTRKKNKQKLTMPPLAKSIKPGTNFFGYVNANWIRRVNMPSYLSSYSVSEEIEDKIEPQLENIINNARKDIMSTANKNLEKDTILIGNLYQSAMDRGTQNLSIKFVKNILANIRCIRDKDDVATTIAEFAKYHISNAMNVYINPEESHSTQLRVLLGPGKITLPDSSYYIVQAPGRIHLLDVYNNMLLKLGDIFDVNNLQNFIGIERIVAEALQEARGENEILMNGAELKRK
jgi:predicted metalloendopeptidase